MTPGARWLLAALVAALAGGGYYAWQNFANKALPESIASGNGRIEATELDVATKTSGRIKEILVNEGDFVEAGQVVARMDTAVLDAELLEAQAKLQRARIGIDTAKSLVTQREAQKAAAIALVGQREAELDAAQRRLTRSEQLAPRGAVPIQRLDDDRAEVQKTTAALSAAKAQVAAAEAAIGTAKSQVIDAEAEVEAARATTQRIQADIDDSVLRAPRDARVQYKVAQLGEVLAAGGRVLNLVDLGDVYMTFFLPTPAAGRVALGSEARLVLDAAPQYVFPAKVSFVASVAQFTPKTVETEEEREKLMFRIKAQVDPDLLRKHITQVKTGLPGMAYVKLDAQAPWPPELEIKLPP
jgi:HlyD family secretion protein